MPFETIEEVKKANTLLDFKWFDEGAMRFFRSEVETDLITIRDGRQFFISSEQFVPSDAEPDPRKFTVREVFPNGKVETLGKFHEHETKQAALQVLAKLHVKSRRGS